MYVATKLQLVSNTLTEPLLNRLGVQSRPWRSTAIPWGLTPEGMGAVQMACWVFGS
jgi:hypothetical protein